MDQPPPPQKGAKPADDTRDRLNKLRNSFTGLNNVPAKKTTAPPPAKPREPVSPRPSAISMAESAGEAAAAANEKVYQITKNKLEAIEKAIREQTRKECMAEAKSDLEIMEVELVELRALTDSLQKEKSTLNRTMEELMGEFERGLDDAAKAKRDVAANLGIVEMEAAQLRQRETQLSTDFKALYKEHTHMKATYETMKANEHTALEKVAGLEKELADEKKKFDALKDHAGKKLESAARVFSSVKQSDNEKDTRIKALETELATTKEKLAGSEKEHAASQNTAKQLRAEIETLNKSIEEKTAKEAQISKALAGTMSQMQQYKKDVEQTADVNERYKVQVVELREKVRTLTTDLETAQHAQQRASAAVEQIRILEVQNTQLKSKLYESGSGGGGGGGGNTQALTAQLRAKEQENRELLAMCDELVAEVDALKAKLPKK